MTVPREQASLDTSKEVFEDDGPKLTDVTLLKGKQVQMNVDLINAFLKNKWLCNVKTYM